MILDLFSFCADMRQSINLRDFTENPHVSLSALLMNSVGYLNSFFLLDISQSKLGDYNRERPIVTVKRSSKLGHDVMLMEK